jgi:hypothetical protein
VVATLRRALSPEEKAEVVNLARPAARSLRSLPYEPLVMILTGYELLSRESAPECWEQAGGRIAEIASRERVANEPQVYATADATLQMHAGLDPHDDWVRAEVERLQTEISARRRDRRDEPGTEATGRPRRQMASG